MRWEFLGDFVISAFILVIQRENFISLPADDEILVLNDEIVPANDEIPPVNDEIGADSGAKPGVG